jgi:hypothetical protein
MMEIQRTPDRISVSLGRKINLGDYNLSDVHISYSSDINPEETIEQAEKRISTVVQTIIDHKIREIVKRGKGI